MTISDEDRWHLSRAEIAVLFAVSERTVRNWPLQVVGHRGRTHLFDLAEVIAWWTKQAAAGHRLQAEREGLTRARRLTAELELAERRRELIPLSEATGAIGAANSLVVAIMRGLPSREAPMLSAMRDALKIEAHLEREIDCALHAAADLLARKATREAAAAAIARGGPILDIEWLTTQGIPWEPQRLEPVEVQYTGKA